MTLLAAAQGGLADPRQRCLGLLGETIKPLREPSGNHNEPNKACYD